MSRKKNDELLFSPIQSPVAELPKGNLTGKPRKLKDGAADIHNLLLTWKNLHIDGINLINRIANIKLEKVFNTDVEEESRLPLSLEPICELLLTLLSKMEKVVKKLNKVKDVMKGLKELGEYQCGDTQFEIFFKTWNIDNFLDTVSKICDMFKAELTLKRCLVESIAHSETRQLMMFYSASWIHEPYLSADLDFLVEAMLTETGLR